MKNTIEGFMDDLQDKGTHLIEFLSNKYPKIDFGRCEDVEDCFQVFMDWNGSDASYHGYFTIDKNTIYTQSIFRAFYGEQYNPRPDEDHVVQTHPMYEQVIKDVAQCLSDVGKMKATNALNSFNWN